MTSGCSVTAIVQPASPSAAVKTSYPLSNFETHLQHVHVVIVILDIKNSSHKATSGTFRNCRVCTMILRTVSTR
jgi:hypothetical protein